MKSFFENLKEKFYIYKLKILIIIFIIILLFVLCIGSFYIYKYYQEKEVSFSEFPISNDLNSAADNIIPQIETIIVDIKGNVKNPGVYEVKAGSRVNDVINMAGGLLKNSNTRFINLSKVVNDSDVIVIYTNKEIEEAKKNDIIYVETPCVCEEVNNSCIENNINNETISNNSNEKININTAKKEELMLLNGIGETKATSIIEYRSANGEFKTLEDIKKVDGISDTVFEKIKDSITI